MPATPLAFPCDYPVKVMGRDTPEFRARVLEVLAAEVAPDAPPELAERPSRNGTYVSLTCTLRVASREQLDRIYRKLHATGLVRYAL